MYNNRMMVLLCMIFVLNCGQFSSFTRVMVFIPVRLKQKVRQMEQKELVFLQLHLTTVQFISNAWTCRIPWAYRIFFTSHFYGIWCSVFVYFYLLEWRQFERKFVLIFSRCVTFSFAFKWESPSDRYWRAQTTTFRSNYVHVCACACACERVSAMCTVHAICEMEWNERILPTIISISVFVCMLQATSFDDIIFAIAHHSCNTEIVLMREMEDIKHTKSSRVREKNK